MQFPLNHRAAMTVAARCWWPDLRTGAQPRGGVAAPSCPSCFQLLLEDLLRGGDTRLYALVSLIHPMIPDQTVRPALCGHHRRSCLKYGQRDAAFPLHPPRDRRMLRAGAQNASARIRPGYRRLCYARAPGCTLCRECEDIRPDSSPSPARITPPMQMGFELPAPARPLAMALWP